MNNNMIQNYFNDNVVSVEGNSNDNNNNNDHNNDHDNRNDSNPQINNANNEYSSMNNENSIISSFNYNNFTNNMIDYYNIDPKGEKSGKRSMDDNHGHYNNHSDSNEFTITELNEVGNSNNNTNHGLSSNAMVRSSPTLSHSSISSLGSRFEIKFPKSIELRDEHVRMLSAFDRYTCGIMSMKNGPTENPWRTLLLPLSQQYPVMFKAISAMTCFHVARGDSKLRSQGMKHMKNAIVDLVHGLSEKSIPPDVPEP
ncbi:unnamed protein product [[Candida] boidinii]|nr:unnamed protein product [[Candida] boidinii]